MNGWRSEDADPIEVLLVEDNPGDIRLTVEAFKEGRIDNTLNVVTDGVEALDYLHRRGKHADAVRPSVILLDLNLPRKNGDEVLEDVKSDPELRRIPVVVLTSSRSHADVLRSYDLHANAYLTKPVDPFEFIETVGTFEELWLSIVRLPHAEN